MSERGRIRASIAAALESIEAGDVRGAEAVLIAVLEDSEAGRLPHLPCPECGVELRWPGRLQDHLRVVHDIVDEELRDAA